MSNLCGFGKIIFGLKNDAAAIVFYKSEFPPNKVKKQEEKGWDTFIHVVNAYRNQNGERFKLHWMSNKKKIPRGRVPGV